MARNSLKLILCSAACAIGSAAIAQNVAEGGRKFTSDLTGEAEIPPGDLDGTGSATFTVNPGQKRFCYSIEVNGIGTPTAAHIHVGAAGTAPPNNVVIPLDTPTDGDVEACEDISRELALAIIKDPANYYLNVHNAEFPAGALRGQLG